MIKIDLRSDTFTMPDEGMRQAIYTAEVGNAGFHEDPSVTALEREVAAYFGVAAGLFLPSATMAGQVAIRVWTDPGDMVLLEEYGHSYYFETGAMTMISGVTPRLVRGDRGLLSPERIQATIGHPENPYARTSLIILENTANFGGGTIYPREQLAQIFALAADHDIPVHVDGARIWNAIQATGADPKDLMPPGGSLSVCFSKGLGAPMGALLLGSADFIAEARRVQCMLGGVMRQVGFMAAAASYGFRHNMPRLREDHDNCAYLAGELAGLPGIELQPAETNILYFRVQAGAPRAARLIEDMAAQGVGVFNLGDLVRLVTSLNVTRADCVQAAGVIRRLMTAD